MMHKVSEPSIRSCKRRRNQSSVQPLSSTMLHTLIVHFVDISIKIDNVSSMKNMVPQMVHNGRLNYDGENGYSFFGEVVSNKKFQHKLLHECKIDFGILANIMSPKRDSMMCGIGSLNVVFVGTSSME